MHQFPFC